MKLKRYNSTETDRGAGLTCPRSACGGKFIVNLEQIRRDRKETGIKTIPCPYCFRVSRLPLP